MGSVFVKSTLKLFLVAGLMVWASQLYASGCRDVTDYDICMYAGYTSCSQTMTRCTSTCPNPPLPPPNCQTLCAENLYVCQNVCYQNWCI
jgi:hypothetical protein